MPTVLRRGPYRFSFYSADGQEPRHVHVDRDHLDAKFWLDPNVRRARNRGFSSSELRRIKSIVQANVELLRNAWDDRFKP